MEKDKFEEFELVCYSVLAPLMGFCALIAFISYLNGTETFLKFNNTLWVTLLLTRIWQLLAKNQKKNNI